MNLPVNQYEMQMPYLVYEEFSILKGFRCEMLWCRCTIIVQCSLPSEILKADFTEFRVS